MREFLATPSPCPESCGPNADPDAELLRLGVEYRRRLARMDAGASALGDEEYDRLGNQVDEIEDLMVDIQPSTIAGLTEKLFVAWRGVAVHENQPTNGPPETGADFFIIALWKALKSAERMGGVNV